MNASLMYWILFEQYGFRNSKSYKKCRSSLTLLPPRNFAVFERQYLLEYYIQRAKSQFISSMFPSVRKTVCKRAKMQTMTSAWIPLSLVSLNWLRRSPNIPYNYDTAQKYKNIAVKTLLECPNNSVPLVLTRLKTGNFSKFRSIIMTWKVNYSLTMMTWQWNWKCRAKHLPCDNRGKLRRKYSFVFEKHFPR